MCNFNPGDFTPLVTISLFKTPRENAYFGDISTRSVP